MTTPARKLTTRYRPVRSMSVNDIVEMHQLSATFREGPDLPTFLRDLQTYDGVIIVRDRDEGAIRGFSTIKKIPLQDGERRALGVCSGETVLDPACGGDRALDDAFTRHLLHLWLTSRGLPLVWLISKNCQPSLRLANTFVNCHPRPDGQNSGWRVGHQLSYLGEISSALLRPHLIKERLKIQGRRKSAERSLPRVVALSAGAV